MTIAADRAEARAARRIAAAFRHALAKARARVDRPALVAAIARGDRYGALRVVEAALGGAEGLAALEAAWGHAAAEAGRLAADEAPDLPPSLRSGVPVRKRLTFNFLAGRTPGVLGRWAAQLRQSLEAILRRAVAAALDRWLGRAPPEQVAEAVLASIGLSERDVLRLANYRAYLENLDRAALRSQLRDARNDPRILAAIREQEPLPPEYVDALVARFAAKLEAGRAEFIGRTEALRARWTGTIAAWQQQVDTGALTQAGVRVFWEHRHDDRVRHAHREIPVLNPNGVALGEAFASPLGGIRYPGDPAAPIANVAHCRCSLDVRLRSEALAA